MSRGEDQDYQPEPHRLRGFQTAAAERPRRATRKTLDYKEQPVVVVSDEEAETTEGTTEGAVERVPVSGRGTKGLWALQSESVWSDIASDSTVKSECW